uniref:Uncharacterized protein n=1 Tax=Anguilla anguilla TaxID=7936 RepID=A0A0E9QQG6_ANGAN
MLSVLCVLYSPILLHKYLYGHGVGTAYAAFVLYYCFSPNFCNNSSYKSHFLISFPIAEEPGPLSLCTDVCVCICKA